MWLEIQHFQKFKYGSWSFQFGYSPLSNCRWLIVGRCRQFFSFFFLFGRVGVVFRSNLYINRLKSRRFFPKIRNWLPLTIRQRNGMQRQAEFFCFICLTTQPALTSSKTAMETQGNAWNLFKVTITRLW